MCRFAAYLGPDIKLEQFLTQPEHSLLVQSYAPRELVYATVNADGYGVGWYNDDDQPASYCSPMPIWSDPNLENLGRTLSSPLWLANVRSATQGHSVNHSNTQPFYVDDLMFMHNGYIGQFNELIRANISSKLTPDILAGIQGTTDSEYLFALLRQLLADNDDISIEDALAECFNILENWLGDEVALLNILISDGEILHACRHAVNHESPSLYFSNDDEKFPQAQLIASERLTSGELWQAVPEHQILTLSLNEPPELISL